MLDITIQNIQDRCNSLHIGANTTPSESAVLDIIEQYTSVVLARVHSRGIREVPVNSEAYNVCRLIATRLIVAEVVNMASSNQVTLSTELFDQSMEMLDSITKRPEGLGDPVAQTSDRVGTFAVKGVTPVLFGRLNRFNRHL